MTFKLQLALCAIAATVLPTLAGAISVDMSGNYRFEYNTLNSAFMSGSSGDYGRRDYFLNHLNLTAKVIPMDSISIVSNFEVFPNSRYPGSALGNDFGAGTANSATYPSGSIGQSELSANYLEINQLYMTWSQDYGGLMVGRVPLQFGLGMTHSAGNGLFDHWVENHDLVAYKVIMGNLYIMPMIGRVSNGYGFAAGSQGTEIILNADYTNPEVDATFAIMHEIRSAGQAANDAGRFFAPYEANQTTGSAVIGALSTTLTSIYYAKGWDRFRLRVEAGFMSGNTGIQYTSYNGGSSTGTAQVGSNPISLSGYGVAVEADFLNPESKWNWSWRTGIASGDNPQTQNFEGFFFNRNYNIAMLLFNQPLGSYDALRTNLGRQRQPGTSYPYSVYSNDQTADEDYLSNAIYLSPKFDYQISDRWTWNNTLAYAITQTNPSYSQSGVGSDLGVEYDVGVTYKPTSRFQWVTQAGLFSPGSVWKEGSANRDTIFVWGWQSKFGISF